MNTTKMTKEFGQDDWCWVCGKPATGMNVERNKSYRKTYAEAVCDEHANEERVLIAAFVPFIND